MHLKALAAGAMLALLAACAAPTTSPTADAPGATPLAQLADFAVSDLEAADADAQAHGDEIAHACYPALIRFVQAAPTGQQTVLGAFSAFQKTRDLAKGVRRGVPDYLVLGCAPLVADIKGDAAALVGTLAALVGRAGMLVPK